MESPGEGIGGISLRGAGAGLLESGPAVTLDEQQP
jgi:hypothetical protein